MKTKIFHIATILLILAVAPLVRASENGPKFPRFSFKLTGGLGWLANGGGDIETLRNDTQATFQSLLRVSHFEYSFDWPGFQASPEAGAELILHLSPHVGFGLGSGVLFGSRSQGAYSYSYSVAAFLQGSGYSEDDHASYTQDFKFRAVPIRASLYVFDEFGPFSVYGFGGAELAFASIDHIYTVTAALQEKGLSTYAPKTEHDVDMGSTAKETVTSRGLGWRAGLGLEVKIAGPISLGFEISGRLLRLKSWTGDGTVDGQTRDRYWLEGQGWYRDKTTPVALTPSGKWLYVFDFDPSLSYNYTLENLLVESPESPNAPRSTYFKSRDVAVDLSGLTAGLSLRLRL